VVPSDRTRDNGNTLKHRRFRVSIRKLYCAVRATKYWNMLPREAVESPSSEILKNYLHMVLDNWL